MPFPFAEFALHLFAVIHFTHESAVSPCSESMNWRWSWGPLTQEVRGDVGREGRCGEKGKKIVQQNRKVSIKIILWTRISFVV